MVRGHQNPNMIQHMDASRKRKANYEPYGPTKKYTRVTGPHPKVQMFWDDVISTLAQLYDISSLQRVNLKQWVSIAARNYFYLDMRPVEELDDEDFLNFSGSLAAAINFVLFLMDTAHDLKALTPAVINRTSYVLSNKIFNQF